MRLTRVVREAERLNCATLSLPAIAIPLLFLSLHLQSLSLSLSLLRSQSSSDRSDGAEQSGCKRGHHSMVKQAREERVRTHTTAAGVSEARRLPSLITHPHTSVPFEGLQFLLEGVQVSILEIHVLRSKHVVR